MNSAEATYPVINFLAKGLADSLSEKEKPQLMIV
jgi:hypothetical protein